MKQKIRKIFLVSMGLMSTSLMFAQKNNGQITGVVKDESGLAIPNASIQILNKSLSVDSTLHAANNGVFRIDGLLENENYTLIVGSEGFEKDTLHYLVHANEKLTTIVTLKKYAQLSDVVVVGYGSSSKKLLTTSIVSVKAEDFNKGTNSDPLQMLQGKVPGLNMTRSGDPNENAAILIRGSSTLRDGANSPLIVVDGVPGVDIKTIANDDIATMDVLKDAAATAIYGNRGANGIIMITTKRAKKGQPKISYSGYTAVDKVSHQIKMMDTDQLHSYLSKNNSALDATDDLGYNTNWQKQIERNSALSTSHNISIGGGSENTLYTANLNYFKQNGILKNSGVERVTGRLSIEQRAINNKLKLNFNVINSVNSADEIPFQSLVLGNALRYLPTSPVYDSTGAYFENMNHTSYYNPAAMINNSYIKIRTQSLVANFMGELQLPFNLTYNFSTSYKSVQTDNATVYSSYYTNTYSYLQSTTTLRGTDGTTTRSSYRDESKILENFFRYKNSFGKHNINTILGYSYQKDITGNGFQASNTNFPEDGLGFYWLGWGNTPSTYTTDWGSNLYREKLLISDYFRTNYDFDRKYLLEVSVRHDGASVFGNNHKWGWFPSASGAWRISQEDFFKRQNLFNDLKLRVGYGVSGNSEGIDALTPVQTYGTTSGSYFYYNGQWISPIGVTQNANPNLKWEKTSSINVGLDFAMLHNRVSGSIDVYNKKTNDLIWNYTVSTTQYAVGNILANAGSMQNKGIEISLNATVVNHSDFGWTTSLNLAHNVNKLLSLTNDQFKLDSITTGNPNGWGQSSSTIQLLKPGHPVGQFFTYRYAGKDANGVSEFYKKDGTSTSDMTQLSSADYTYAGNAQPKLIYGWSNSFRYKRFDLNIFVRGVLGNKIFNVTKADLYRPSTATWYNLPASANNESMNDINDYIYSSRFIENGSYLRLDNATLGYNWMPKNNAIKSLRVYATVNNLFVITSYTGIDPEMSMAGITPGIDNNNFYPKTRTFLLGVNLSF